MPRATTLQDEVVQKDLKSCPGGFVKLRKMTYGELLHRRGMTALKFKGGQSRKEFEGELELLNQKVTEYEFSHCIVEHNLEDETGRQLNFSNPADIAKLDPRIGGEIDRYITEMNQFEEDEGES